MVLPSAASGAEAPLASGRSKPTFHVYLAGLSGYDIAAQWKLTVTRCGLSHTCSYSMWRATIGGLISSVSW
jgi:hypothetical protein